MRKEISIAIFIGIILGGIILYGIKIANDSTKSISSTPTPTPESVLSPTPTILTPKDSIKTSITISSHITGQVLNEKEITLIGKTLPNTNVSIIWEEDETIIRSDNLGNFNQKISLIPGENNIQLDIVDSSQKLISEALKLYYTTKVTVTP